MTSVVGLIGDNTSTNCAFTRMFGRFFLVSTAAPVSTSLWKKYYKNSKMLKNFSVPYEEVFFLDNVSVASSAHINKTETMK